MTATQMRHWYVVETHPHAEARAVTNLRRQGFETYMPCYRKRRSHARRIEIVAAPLFPRYLFVAIDIAAQRWRAIQSTFGVARLVSNGEFPSVLQEDIVEGLRRREDDHGLIELEKKFAFQRGDKVQILGGAFEACLGLFEEIADRDRAAVLLNFLGRNVRVVFDTESVVAV